MRIEQKAFQIDVKDNVATALEDIEPGKVELLGDILAKEIYALAKIPKGHKIALKQIAAGEDIIKYGVCIGRAGMEIEAGTWVHLHNIHSIYDERSSHLDVVTGAPKDTEYN